MIVLHTFGPFLGTPDSSPFVIKAMAMLGMAGIPYRAEIGNPFAGPHRFLPYIVDDGVKVPDSTLIRAHIERRHGFDFDRGLSAPEKAVAWSMERMCEDHLYFAMLHARWIDAANFKAGIGRYMFGPVPAPARPLAKWLLRRMNAGRLSGHGLGRHSVDELQRLGVRDIDALAEFLADKPFLMGRLPCGADATVFGLVEAILTPPLETPLRTAMAAHANLVAYRERFARRYFPDVAGGVDRAAA